MRERGEVDADTRRALADLRIAMVGLPPAAGDLFRRPCRAVCAKRAAGFARGPVARPRDPVSG